MANTEATWTVGGGVLTWIFRLLLVVAAALMVYSWFQPWWIADIATIRGTDDLVLHPWGIDAVGPVRMASDPALYEMPGFFKPFVWTYFGVAMLALLVSLFVNKKFKLGPVRLPLATTLIIVVGLSYLITVGLAYYIGDMRASGLEMNFIGRSDYTDPTSHRKVRMDSDLQVGYWYALYAGVALVALGIIRFLFLREWRK
ncbi:hypothetical protein [Maritimibacter dapengensis]|uniref:Uncharacterized protein n=1 Tax=Maritimibacter dapengensis TaxID=2836868 RepID=A0ABS6SZU6_9RHOB|nr:hypothetical protein [Maritimibacter dapengensis]MBV7378455.1 hypothetical protein [Maritimibacter dapengensis]